MTEAEIIAAAESLLASPQSATVDGRSATSRSAADWIAIRNYLDSRIAESSGGAKCGLKFVQLVPGGCG